MWSAALGQLQTQMTRATFDTWVKGTWLVSRDNGRMVVGTKNSFAKDWLENRLYDTIQRTVTGIVGQPVDIQVVIDEPHEKNKPNDPPPVEETLPEDRPAFLDKPNGNQSKKPTPKTKKKTSSNSGKIQPFTPKDNGLLAVDIRLMNQTGYQPIPAYYSIFIVPYLNQKYGHAYGSKVYLLWEQESAISGDYLMSDEFCNWTTPGSYKFKDLAERLGVSVEKLTGKDGYCERFRQARLAGYPLLECCGAHDPDRTFNTGKNCKYWITGVLELLSDEGMLTVEQSGGRRNNRIKIQVWRSWPVLSPHQVNNYLAPGMQDKHMQWLNSKEAKRAGLSLKKWQAQEIPCGIEQFSDREIGRQCHGQFIRNPFRLRKLEKK